MMTVIHTPHACPRCGSIATRCTGCGTQYAYNPPLGCMTARCRESAAKRVCRCGRVHDPAA